MQLFHQKLNSKLLSNKQRCVLMQTAVALCNSLEDFEKQKSVLKVLLDCPFVLASINSPQTTLLLNEPLNLLKAVVSGTSGASEERECLQKMKQLFSPLSLLFYAGKKSSIPSSKPKLKEGGFSTFMENNNSQQGVGSVGKGRRLVTRNPFNCFFPLFSNYLFLTFRFLHCFWSPSVFPTLESSFPSLLHVSPHFYSYTLPPHLRSNFSSSPLNTFFSTLSSNS